MKSIIRNGAFVFTIVFFISCNPNKINSEIDKVGKKEYTGETEDPVKLDPISVKGEVQKTNSGKNGYTAELMTKSKMFYQIIISIADMDNSESFKTIKIGDIIKVKGDLWKMGDNNYIKVKELEIE